MDIFEWIKHELAPVPSTSGKFIYDRMLSQSGYSLPLIYQPFNANKSAHWRDRGAAFDYLHTTGGGRLLDFGPGDGWPSLIVAPYVDEVVGVDGSAQRVRVCTENAARLEIPNAHFIEVKPGKPLPFDAGYFDGIMAASSIEQTPDPKVALRELFRVLKPAGRMRIKYEALDDYRNGQARDLWLWADEDGSSYLILFNRDIEGERAEQYGIAFALSPSELTKALGSETDLLTFDMLDLDRLKALRHTIIDARLCTLTHPSGTTLADWLYEIGFSAVIPSHSGADFAADLFDRLPAEQRPPDRTGVDAMLQPLVEIVVELDAPLNSNPMITAVK